MEVDSVSVKDDRFVVVIKLNGGVLKRWEHERKILERTRVGEW